MRVLFIDRVLELHRNQRIVARLDLAADEPVFSHHFPSNPMLPASLLLEAFAQAATILIEAGSGFTRKALPGYIQNAKFVKPVRPAASVLFDLAVEQWSDDAAVFRGTATQFEARCASCTMGMITAPLERFYDSRHAEDYRHLYTRWLDGARCVGFGPHPASLVHHALAH